MWNSISQSATRTVYSLYPSIILNCITWKYVLYFNCSPGFPTESEPWVFYRGAEYLLAKQPFDWDAVSLACQMMGAYLLSIHSREELHFIKERLRRVCYWHCSYTLIYRISVWPDYYMYIHTVRWQLFYSDFEVVPDSSTVVMCFQNIAFEFNWIMHNMNIHLCHRSHLKPKFIQKHTP